MTSDIARSTDTVTLTVDGIEVTAPKGTLLIRVAERMGISIPRFCDHPLLEPAGACRQCLVEVEGQRKPVASCTQPVADGMVVRTQLTSPVAAKAQAGIMELLLINHPLDCPMCDKGGECPLQNQAMSTGRVDTRFREQKREYIKPLPISSQVLLDRERCVLCQRCTRFSDEIAGDRFIDLMDRSADEQIGVFRADSFGDAPGESVIEEPEYVAAADGSSRADGAGPAAPSAAAGDEPFNSYFSGNTVQICPVGALTGAQYRFRARPFDLVSDESVCEHCAAGCAQRTDWRRGKVLRRMAGDDPEVNEEWNCDKGRWAFQYTNAFDRITTPMVRDAGSGELRQASWPEALTVAAEGLLRARVGQGAGVLTGGRLTVEDAYAYAKFARLALGTNDIDFRARPLSGEETDFLAARVAGVTDVTYADIEKAPAVLLVGLEPEEECPILFLRLRKAVRRHGLKVHAVSPYVTRSLEKLTATVYHATPGGEAAFLAGNEAARTAMEPAGTLIFVGERLATTPGGLSAAAALADATGARLAWVPRRAGDRGALEAGCLPTVLPGGRPVTDAAARADLATAWSLDADALPGRPGRDTDAILAAAAAGELDALVVAGVDPSDLADPRLADEALDRVGFLVSLEQRLTAVGRRADVVLPVAPAVEKAGTYLDWEGRLRPFERVLKTTAMSDHRVLTALADAMNATTAVRAEANGADLSDVALDCGDVAAVRAQLAVLAGGPARAAARPEAPRVAPVAPPAPGDGQAVLATWHQLIDLGSMQDGDENLAGTARPAVVRLSKATAATLGGASSASGFGVVDGDPVTVSTERGAITLPALLTEMPGGIVWLPTNSPGSTVYRTLGVAAGAIVSISGGLR